MRSRKVALALLAGLMVLLLAGCGGSSDNAQQNKKQVVKPQIARVTITDKGGFEPAEIKIKVRTRLVWTNKGKKLHNVFLDAAQASSGNIPPGQSAGHTFNELGEFTYHDPLNPKFKGKVIVY